MKQIILGLGLMAMSSLSVFGCDQCSCASSGFMGIVPQFGKHYVGLRYQYQHFETVHSATSFLENPLVERSKEHFQTLELFGSYYPHKRVQLLASVPYVHRTQISPSEGTFVGQGISDVRIGATYTVIATPDTLGKKLRHNLLIGSSLEAPTGATKLKRNDELLHQNLQPGSGSWDLDMNLRYIIRIKRWGISSAANYRLNTNNRSGYKFGDRISGLLGAFYWTSYRNMTFMPQAGFNFDYTLKDIDNRRLQTKTGGHQVSARADLQVGFKRFVGTIGYALPFSHSLSNGEVTPKHQCSVSILILI
jgi:hypothetical protein